MTKKCTKCKLDKDPAEFVVLSSHSSGRGYRCKECHRAVCREYAARNKDKAYLNASRWSKANKERKNEQSLAWKRRNPEKMKEYTQRNAGKRNSYTAKRWAAKLQATPPWLNKEQLQEIASYYELAKELQWLSEEPLEVDHMTPLQGKNISGLHVPWNLQILPRPLNRRKSAKLLP